MSLKGVTVTCIGKGCTATYQQWQAERHWQDVHSLRYRPRMRRGSYWCGQCNRGHRPVSDIGSNHRAHKVTF